jgi:hydrogenase maturation protein HypF
MTKIINVKGAVQGVGYRPFIAEKATEYGLKGNVINIGASVRIIVQGNSGDIDAFTSCIQNEMPPGAFIISIDVEDITENNDEISVGFDDFTITDSKEMDLTSEIPVFLPDIGICEDCTEEMKDPDNRRYRYPLISCAVCGPRISILDRLPYDRHTTTMQDFEMCPSCSNEYESGRRRYAQTISCHDCGPQIIFRTTAPDGTINEIQGDDAVSEAVKALKDNRIIGLKGVSGYQLVCKPDSEVALRLRNIKGREKKPFAIMFADLAEVKRYAYITPLEEDLLQSSARPIVLVKKKHRFPKEVVNTSLYTGAFLPASGIHRLLCDAIGPLIVTSANISGAPIIYDDEEFIRNFSDQIDGICYHHRKINMGMDDSVMFVIRSNDTEYAQFLRRARGYAPISLFTGNRTLSGKSESTVLSTGGDLKNTFSFGKKDRILPSQYIGDLADRDTIDRHKSLYEAYREIFCMKPDLVVSDLHPGYFSAHIGRNVSEQLNIRHILLQHHFAHIYSVMAENSLTKAIGVAFDGTGFGTDGNVWGGEFLYINGTRMFREGHLSTVRLVGGDIASKNAEDVCRCYKLSEPENMTEFVRKPPDARMDILSRALKNRINTFESSSMGRLFDAVSALLNICKENSYEGECAIALENEAIKFLSKDKNRDYPRFRFNIRIVDKTFVADQRDLFLQIEDCLKFEKYSKGAISYGFHMAIVNMVLDVCRMISEKRSEKKVCLSGGSFNNRILLSDTARLLEEDGFSVYWNQELPLGDGGISAGQAYYGLLDSLK